jgi:hypothetical protein
MGVTTVITLPEDAVYKTVLFDKFNAINCLLLVMPVCFLYAPYLSVVINVKSPLYSDCVPTWSALSCVRLWVVQNSAGDILRRVTGYHRREWFCSCSWGR